MKKLIILLFGASMLIMACQKPVLVRPGTRVMGTDGDSLISQGDTLTYEVLTKDPGGWFGVWNNGSGVLTSNGLNQITWGEPNY